MNLECEAVNPTRKHLKVKGRRGQSWLFPADFGPILGCFWLFKTKFWVSPADISSHRHSLSVSGERAGELLAVQNISEKSFLVKSYIITILNFFYEAFYSVLKKKIYIFSIVF